MSAFFLSENIRNGVSMLLICASAVILSSGQENQSENVWRRGMALLPFALWIPLFFQIPGFLSKNDDFSLYSLFLWLSRMFLIWMAVWLYLKWDRRCAKNTAIYISGLFTVIYTTVQNLRLVLRALVLLGSQTKELTPLSAALISYSTALIQLILTLWMKQHLDRGENLNISGTDCTLITVVNLMELYIKWCTIVIRPQNAVDPAQINTLIFSVFASFDGMIIAVLLQKNERLKARERDLQMEQFQLGYEMQNAKRALQTNNDIRRLYHDMKNHLLAIQSMAGEETELQNYLTELLPEFEGYEDQVVTGNSAIDALLSEKMRRARLDHIRFNICLELSELKNMRTVDLITIYGNAVDNAIEAEQGLPEGKERIVYLKSGKFANMIVLRFSNQFFGKINQKNGRLLTGKQEGKFHGIGLSSIRRAVQRYGGTMRTEYDNEKGWFELTLMIPIEENRAE